MRIGRMLALMQKEAEKRNAPVFHAERSTNENPFTILVFTMLSSRTRDGATAKAVARLFARAKTPKEILSLGNARLGRMLRGVGFHRVKARHLMGMCRELEKEGGRVPDTREGLMMLPGVGRKTANIVLARAFGRRALGVDVHVHRISNRLGLVSTEKPEQTEKALLESVPERHVRTLNRTLVAFGQTVCLPRKPKCDECPVRTACRRIGVD